MLFRKPWLPVYVLGAVYLYFMSRLAWAYDYVYLSFVFAALGCHQLKKAALEAGYKRT